MNIVGMTTILISVLLMGLVQVQDRTLISTKSNVKEILKERATFEIIAANIKTQLMHPTALERTIDSNIPGSCQSNLTTNCERNYRPVNVLIYFNSADNIDTRIHGFNREGKKCLLTDPDCIVRIQLEWERNDFECIGTCTSVRGRLQGRYLPNPAARGDAALVLNLNNYDFEIKVNMN